MGKKVTNEIVQMFFEDNEPIAILHMNGTTKFYRITKAHKDFVGELLGVEIN